MRNTSYNAIVRGETRVVVTRGNSSSAYTPVFSTKAVYATGACAAGKSTYALYGLANARKLSATIYQPSKAAASACHTNMRSNAGTRTWHVRSVEDLFANACDAKSFIGADDLVVVDEIHTQTPAMAFAVEVVRQFAKRYILITATPAADASIAAAVTQFTVTCDISCGLGNLMRLGTSLNGTAWDPSLWPGSCTGVITYPVDDMIANNMLAYYKTKRVPAAKVVKGGTITGSPFVKLVMPGVGDGLTMRASLLIDTGCDYVKVSWNGVIYNNYRRLSEAEREQRWSRVGRVKSGLVIAPDTRTAPHDISTSMLMEAHVGCQASGANLTRPDSWLPHMVIHRGAAKYAVKTTVPLVAFFGRIGRHIRASDVKLYVGKVYSVPHVVLDVSQDVDYRVMSNVVGDGDDIPLAAAVAIFNEDPTKFLIAILQLVFGRKGGYKGKLNMKEHLRGPLKAMGIRMNNVIWSYIYYNTHYRVKGNEYYYTTMCSHDTGSIDLADDTDFHNGNPQRNFAKCVSWLAGLEVIRVPSSINISNKYLHGMMVKDQLIRQGVHPHPGPKALVSKLAKWATGHNMTIVFVRFREEFSSVTFDTFEKSSNSYQRALSTRTIGKPMSLICCYNIVKYSKSYIIDDNEKSYIVLKGLRLAEFSDINATALRVITASYTTYKGMDISFTALSTTELPMPMHCEMPVCILSSVPTRCVGKQLHGFFKSHGLIITFVTRNNINARITKDLDDWLPMKAQLRVKPTELFSVRCLVYIKHGGFDFNVMINERINHYSLIGYSFVGLTQNVVHDTCVWMYCDDGIVSALQADLLA